MIFMTIVYVPYEKIDGRNILEVLYNYNITARLGGQYGGIFSSRLAVLARAQRGTIQKPRTEYSPVLPDLKECSNRFIV